MAAAALRIAHISTLLPHPSLQTNKNPRLSIPIRGGSFTHPWPSRKVNPSVCCSSKSDQKAEENGASSPIDSFPSPDDVDYLWKLAAGSVGGGAAVKYGSILFPDLTKPNILQALLMISLPVFTAVLLLIKESRTEK